MKPKTIFFDIDGTLLDHDKQIPPSTKEAISALQQKGHQVAIATGRGPFMFEDIRKELGIHTYVSYNGQYVVWEGKVIYSNPISPELIQSITEFSAKRDHPLVFMGADAMKSTVPYHEYVQESLASLKFDHPEADPLYYRKQPIYQCLLFCKEDEENEYLEAFGDHLQFIRWHPLSTDILPAVGSKAIGIAKTIERLKADPDDVYAFGDGLNDIEMLQFVKHSVAMGNAPEEVQRAAKYVTKDVADNGIYHGLKMLNLLP